MWILCCVKFNFEISQLSLVVFKNIYSVQYKGIDSFRRIVSPPPNLLRLTYIFITGKRKVLYKNTTEKMLLLHKKTVSLYKESCYNYVVLLYNERSYTEVVLLYKEYFYTDVCYCTR
jgi:hypothetical protein